MVAHARSSTLTTISGRSVSTLGLAGYPGQSERCVKAAFDGGINYYFFYGPGHASIIRGLRRLVTRSRDHVVVATGSGSRRPDGLERVRRRYAAELGTPVIDVFFAEYLNPSDDLSVVFGDRGPIATIERWRDTGLVRYLGVTTHDADLAHRCIDDARVDVLMLRCNMAHRRLATTVFPEARRAGLPLVAFTATRWRTLLKGHPDWDDTPPSALDCYRYCLAQPGVSVVLTAATTTPELRENLPLLRAPTLRSRERRRWEAYGDLVYDIGKGTFDTAWP